MKKKKTVKKPLKKTAKKSAKVRLPFPHEFIMEELSDIPIRAQAMFGGYGIYLEDKIVILLRDRPNTPRDNGIWLATTHEHHESLLRDFPNMRSIEMFGEGVTGYQVIGSDMDDFEEAAMRVCEFVRRRDPRIGKVPKPKSLRKPKAAQKPKKK